MPQRPRVTPLDDPELRRLEEQRAWVLAQQQLLPGAIVSGLGLIQQLLDSSLIGAAETWKLQSLGVIFGDALAEELGVPWVILDDEYGRDPAILLRRDTDALIFPLTMISKRVEAGEVVDVAELFRAVASDARARFG